MFRLNFGTLCAIAVIIAGIAWLLSVPFFHYHWEPDIEEVPAAFLSKLQRLSGAADYYIDPACLKVTDSFDRVIDLRTGQVFQSRSLINAAGLPPSTVLIRADNLVLVQLGEYVYSVDEKSKIVKIQTFDAWEAQRNVVHPLPTPTLNDRGNQRIKPQTSSKSM